jgi:DNA gyrase subunit A
MKLDYPEDLSYVELPDYKGKKMRLDENIAYLIGQFLSDGYFESSYGNSNGIGRFNFNSSSVGVIERVSQALKLAFDYDATILSKGTNPLEDLPCDATMNLIRVNRKDINDYLAAALGIDPSWKSLTKHVPEMFFRSPRPVLSALLSGLIDGDGSIHKDRCLVHYGTVSEQLADDVQLIMQQLGVLS